MALRTSPALLALLALHAILVYPSLALLPILQDSNIVDENNLEEGTPQPLSLTDAVYLFQRLQQERQYSHTEDNTDEHGDPRFIGITDGGLYRGDLVVYLPVTFLLPTFAFRSRYSMAGKKKSGWLSFLWGKSQYRSYGGSDGSPMDIRGPVDKVLSNQVRYDPGLEEYQSNGDFGALLSRLDAYFHYLRVHDDDCRMRTICQLARDPATYTPLSHLVLSALKRSESFSRPSAHSRAVFRFFRYYWAAGRGAAGENCSATYHRCPADIEDVVNMSVLNFWQRLASFVSIKLSDE